MKKIITIKNLLMAMVFSVAVLGGYQAYEQIGLTNVESFLLENVEALAKDDIYDQGELPEVNVTCSRTCDYEGYCWKYRPGPWIVPCMSTEDPKNSCTC